MIIFELLSQQTIMSVGQLLDYFTRCLNNPKCCYYFGVCKIYVLRTEKNLNVQFITKDN